LLREEGGPHKRGIDSYVTRTYLRGILYPKKRLFGEIHKRKEETKKSLEREKLTPSRRGKPHAQERTACLDDECQGEQPYAFPGEITKKRERNRRT